MATILTESFAGAASGTNISAGNSIFDVIAPTVNGTIKFDNAQAEAGTTSGRFQVTTTAAAPSVQTPLGGTLNLVFFRVYMFWQSYPPSGATTLMAVTATGTRQADFQIISDGTSQMQARIRNLNTSLGTTTSTFTTAQWVRCEWMVNKTGSNQEARVFIGTDLENPAASYTEHITGAFTQTAPDRINMGWTTPNQINTLWLDEFKADNNDWVGAVTGPPSATVSINTVLTVGP